MGDLTKQEIAAMKVKEAGNRTKALAASKIHDAEVIDNIKAKFGMGQPAAAPMPAPAPAQMTAPTPAGPSAGMKKGGKVAGKLATRGYGIAKGGKK